MDSIIGSSICGLACIGGAIGAVIIVVVLVMVSRTRSRQKAEIAADWSTTLGQITSARVDEAPDDDVFYHAVIGYSYTVEGQAYTGEQAVGRAANLAGPARRALSRYPVGTQVSVAYNPARPTESRLAVK